MRIASLALTTLLLAPTARAGGPGAEVLEHHGRWESGYGSTFYNVVGRLRNASEHPLAWVKLRVEALNDKGKVVASTETYNESAEILAVEVEGMTASREERARKVKPLAPGAEERFRGSFLKEETPAFTDTRVKVIDASPAR